MLAIALLKDIVGRAAFMALALSSSLSNAAPLCTTLAAYKELVESGLVANQRLDSAPDAALCGPTCLVNLQQLVHAETGRSISRTPGAVLANMVREVSASHPGIHDGLVETSLLALLQTRMPEQQFSLTVIKSIATDNQRAQTFGKSISFKYKTDLSARQLHLEGRGHAKIIAVDFTDRNSAHYLLVVAHDPATKTIYFSDPNSPNVIAEATYEAAPHPQDGETRTLHLRCRRNCNADLNKGDVYIRSVIDARYESNLQEAKERDSYEAKRLEQVRIEAQQRVELNGNDAQARLRLAAVERIARESRERRAARMVEPSNTETSVKEGSMAQGTVATRPTERAPTETRRPDAQHATLERTGMAALKMDNPLELQARIEIVMDPIPLDSPDLWDQGILRDVRFRAGILQDTFASEIPAADVP